MTTIDQHRKLDTPWPAEIDQLIHRRPNGAASVQHIVNQYYRAIGDVRWDLSLVYNRTRPDRREIISIEVMSS